MTDKSVFTVEVRKMRESHQETWWVYLTNTSIRAPGTSFFDDTGVITPFYSTDIEEANHEASDWAKFLGAEFPPCTCIMCKFKD